MHSLEDITWTLQQNIFTNEELNLICASYYYAIIVSWPI